MTAGPRHTPRIGILAGAFGIGYMAVAGQLAHVALTEPDEPPAPVEAPAPHARRADITDRRGAPLALNLPAWSAYARLSEMADPEAAAQALAATLDGVDAEALLARLRRDNYAWIKPLIGPRERQATHDLGLAGVHIGAREARFYPAGRAAAHVLGGVKVKRASSTNVELIGGSGVEAAQDDRLAAGASGVAPEKLRLSLDLRAQGVLGDVMGEAMRRFGANWGSAVLLDARSGQLRALVSLPDFDPNDRPSGDDARTRSLLTNRAVQGGYELGSVFKPIFAAMALDLGLVNPATILDTKSPARIGGRIVRDSHRMDPEMTIAEIIAESSNVGAARMGEMVGPARVRGYLEGFGLTRRTGLEIAEAAAGRPRFPSDWKMIDVVTMSYGYAIAVSPLHVAAAYATLVNGGFKVEPTLDPDAAPPGEAARVISARTSAQMRAMLAGVVEHGTGRRAAVPGYAVGGKTGTAEKRNPKGKGYLKGKNLVSFTAAFPIDDPDYVLMVTLDEAVNRDGPRPNRQAAATAGETAGRAIARLAPLLGVAPAPVAQPVELASR